MQYGYRKDSDERKLPSSFSVVIYLPEYLETLVRPIREKFDPEYSLISANVTLVAPFRTERPLDEISRVVATAVTGIPTLTLELEGIEDCYPDYPVICWKLKGCPLLDQLYRQLYTSLDIALPYKHFCPHVTVAREISAHRLMLVKEKIFPYLPHESFEAQAVDLISPVAGDQWVSVRSFKLVPIPSDT